MISDESSTDSESGRFKAHSKKETNESRGTAGPRREDKFRDLGRKGNDNKPFRRDFDRRHDHRDRYERRRYSRDRLESSRRHSPLNRRRYSRDRSSDKSKRSTERGESSRARVEKKPSNVKERIEIHSDRKHSKSPKKSEVKRNFKNEIRKNVISNIVPIVITESNRERSRSNRRQTSPEHRNNSREKSLKKEIRDSNINEQNDLVDKDKVKSNSPVAKARRSKSKSVLSESEPHVVSDVEQPASYYNMIPATMEISSSEDKAHSISDSSEDEERLRAKLLNLESELNSSKKKKHKKKGKRKKEKSKHKEKDDKGLEISVEVSSTTDIKERLSDNEDPSEENKKERVQTQAAEVSSTQQKKIEKETSEEGEISSDDDAIPVPIDPNDLRHRLKRSVAGRDTSGSPDLRDKLKFKPEVSGPVLPPHMQKSQSPDVEGPALPPHLQEKDKQMGPTLPNEMRKVLADATHDRTVIKYESSDEDTGIGPLPSGSEEKWNAAHRKLEERALNIKIRNLEGGSIGSSDIKSREEWMLELPDAKAKYIGLGPRQFRSKEGPDMTDRSSWTDTPEQKALKAAGLKVAEDTDSSAALQRDAQQRHVTVRDAQQEKAVKKHKKKHKRDESLLDMHQKKLKKKKKKEEKEEGGKTRRPFDRDIDLQANRFDEAQKQAIIKKAQHLDTRFSRGEAKFL